MFTLNQMLLTAGIALFVVAVALVAYDVCLRIRYCRSVASGYAVRRPRPVRWRMTAGLLSIAWAPMLIALSIVLTPLSAASPVSKAGPGVARQSVSAAATSGSVASDSAPDRR